MCVCVYEYHLCTWIYIEYSKKDWQATHSCWVRLWKLGQLRWEHTLRNCRRAMWGEELSGTAGSQVRPTWLIRSKYLWFAYISCWLERPLWLSGEESTCNAAEDTGSIPRWGRSLGGGNSNALQYSCLQNPMARGGAWRATVPRVAKNRMRLTDPACTNLLVTVFHSLGRIRTHTKQWVMLVALGRITAQG